MTEAYPHWHEATLNIASPPREDYNPSQLTPATLAAFVKIPLRELWYPFLLSNWIEYKYPAILYGYLGLTQWPSQDSNRDLSIRSTVQ